ncbi:MAG: hypothetical protein IT371_02350 [Deltaproteobacteria bacterium]|nr:hypothetical protein [Deltaproteobacteria bacterium]
MRIANQWGSSRQLLFALLALAAASCGGSSQGCSLQPISGGFPQAEQIPGGIQARFSSDGLDFVEKNSGTLLAQVLPQGLNFDVPPTCGLSVPVVGDMNICATKSGSGPCQGKTPPCQIQASLTGVALEPQSTSGDTLRLVARVKASTPAGNPITTSGVASCTIALDTTRAGKGDMAFQADLRFSVDPVSKRTRIALKEATLTDLDNGDLSVNGGALCFLADVFFKGFLIDQVKNAVGKLVGQLLDTSLCSKCDTTPCPGGATCDAKTQLCMQGASCVQRLGVEGRMPLASLPSRDPSALDLLAWLGSHVGMHNNGVTLGLLGGVAPGTGPASCVKPRPELRPNPTTPPLPVFAGLTGNTTPEGKPFHLGVGIHQRMLDMAGWSAYTAGTLCLELSTQAMPLLNSDAFSLIMPSLGMLTGGQSAPVKLVVLPASPPRFSLGKGQIVDAGNGNYTIVDPLLTMRFDDLSLDLYVLADQRFVRVMRLTANVSIPVALVLDAKGQVRPVLGALDKAFDKLKVTDSALLGETPADLEAKFPVLLKLALGFLPELLSKGFALPELAGLKIKNATFTSTDANSVLALFGELAPASAPQPPPSPALPAPSPLPAGAEVPQTRLRLVRVELPRRRETLRLRALSHLKEGPEVTVRVDSPHGPQAELSYRLDGGDWSPFLAGTELHLRSPILFLLGRHLLEVRTRPRGEIDAVDSHPARLEFEIRDPAPPAVRVGVPARAPMAAVEERGGCQAVPESVPSRSVGLLVVLVGLVALARRFRRAGRFRALVVLALPLLLAGCPSSVPVTQDSGPAGDSAVPPSCGACSAGTYCCQKSGKCEKEQLSCKPGKTCGPGFTAVAPDGAKTMDEATCTALPVDCECKELTPLQPGLLGRFSALTAAKEGLLASAYESKFGDLVVVSAPYGDLTKQQRELVDGVPAAQPTNAPSGWRGGVSEPGDDVGLYSDIALAADGTAIVAYHDATASALKVAARRGGKWTAHVVAAPAASSREVVGRAVSLLGGEKPAVAFLVLNVEAKKGQFRSELRWAAAKNASPAAKDDWTVTVVDSAPMPCRNLCGSGEACAVATDGSSECKKKDTTCNPACSTTQACIAGKCETILPDQKLAEVPPVLGLWPRALRAGANAVLVYHDAAQGTLKAAPVDGAGGAAKSVVVGGGATDRQGAFCAAVADSGGKTIHVTFQKEPALTLHYLTIDAGTLKPGATETVDDGIRPDGRHYVGADSALVVDGAGAVRVIYQDQQNADLLTALRTGPGTWTPKTVADPHLGRLLKGGPRGYGFFSDLATSGGGQVYGSTFFYDPTLTQKGDLEFFGVK